MRAYAAGFARKEATRSMSWAAASRYGRRLAEHHWRRAAAAPFSQHYHISAQQRSSALFCCNGRGRQKSSASASSTSRRSKKRAISVIEAERRAGKMRQQARRHFRLLPAIDTTRGYARLPTLFEQARLALQRIVGGLMRQAMRIMSGRHDSHTGKISRRARSQRHYQRLSRRQWRRAERQVPAGRAAAAGLLVGAACAARGHARRLARQARRCSATAIGLHRSKRAAAARADAFHIFSFRYTWACRQNARHISHASRPTTPME